MANVNEPPLMEPIQSNGMIDAAWAQFFWKLFRALSGPVRLSSYTVATVPDASLYEGALIYVSNESGGKTVAFSDGTQWRRAQDRAVIS